MAKRSWSSISEGHSTQLAEDKVSETFDGAGCFEQATEAEPAKAQLEQFAVSSAACSGQASASEQSEDETQQIEAVREVGDLSALLPRLTSCPLRACFSELLDNDLPKEGWSAISIRLPSDRLLRVEFPENKSGLSFAVLGDWLLLKLALNTQIPRKSLRFLDPSSQQQMVTLRGNVSVRAEMKRSSAKEFRCIFT